MLSSPNLLLASDLNFTISSSKFWGTLARSDPLASYFTQLIANNNLVDLSLNSPGTTWRNGRKGDAGISKRLAFFII